MESFQLQHGPYALHGRLCGEGPPVVFLHGWPTNALLWTAPMEQLRTRATCIAPDWIGHGRSDKPLDYGYSFAEKAKELDAVLAHLEAEGRIRSDALITLVGHDIGGPVAVLWAHQHPRRVKRLILLNTIAYPFRTPLDALSESILKIPLLKDVFVSPFGLRIVLRTNTKSSGSALNARMQELLEPWQGVPAALKRKALTAPLEQGREGWLHNMASAYAELPCAKALILAKADGLCYAHVRRLAGENPEVPVEHIPQCGHFMPIDRPEAVAKAIAHAATANL